jgi:hypothetical protein
VLAVYQNGEHMELSQELEGCVVTIQLARPLYIIDYAGHVQAPGDGQVTLALLGEPVLQGQGEQAKPLVMDLLLGVTVRQVHRDNLMVSMLTPGNHWSQVTVPSSLIMQVVEMKEFEPSDLPVVTRRVREPARKPLVSL